MQPKEERIRHRCASILKCLAGGAEKTVKELAQDFRDARIEDYGLWAPIELDWPLRNLSSRGLIEKRRVAYRAGRANVMLYSKSRKETES